MHGSPLKADEIGVKHISQCSALKVTDFSVMNAITLLRVTNKINRKKIS
jgi:glycerol dehydrogenase-like iron-containing ADH family enzyme